MKSFNLFQILGNLNSAFFKMKPYGNAYKESTCESLKSYGSKGIKNDAFTYSLTSMSVSSYFTFGGWFTRTVTNSTIHDQPKMYFSADYRHTDGSSNT